MGVETEPSDASVFMDGEEFNRSLEPILLQKGSARPERDPSRMNAHLTVGFEDVIAEPASTHSFDSVWVGSHATFELVRFLGYRLLSALLAVPVAFLLGLLFAVLSCIHIWLVMPAVRGFLVFLPSMQRVWGKLTDLFVSPLFGSLGKSLSSVHVRSVET